jgi:hypothetical protein
VNIPQDTRLASSEKKGTQLAKRKDSSLDQAHSSRFSAALSLS